MLEIQALLLLSGSQSCNFFISYANLKQIISL